MNKQELATLVTTLNAIGEGYLNEHPEKPILGGLFELISHGVSRLLHSSHPYARVLTSLNAAEITNERALFLALQSHFFEGQKDLLSPGSLTVSVVKALMKAVPVFANAYGAMQDRFDRDYAGEKDTLNQDLKALMAKVTPKLPDTDAPEASHSGAGAGAGRAPQDALLFHPRAVGPVRPASSDAGPGVELSDFHK